MFYQDLPELTKEKVRNHYRKTSTLENSFIEELAYERGLSETEIKEWVEWLHSDEYVDTVLHGMEFTEDGNVLS